MNLKSIFHDIKQDAALNQSCASAATVVGATADVQGYEGVAFLVDIQLGEVKDFTVQVFADSASGMGTEAKITALDKTVSTTAGAEGVGMIDVFNPVKRYLRCKVVAPTLSTAKYVSILNLKYGARIKPVGNTGNFGVGV